MLHATFALEDLKIPPSNHLEQLQGDLKGFYSIRINNQFRLIFSNYSAPFPTQIS